MRIKPWIELLRAGWTLTFEAWRAHKRMQTSTPRAVPGVAVAATTRRSAMPHRDPDAQPTEDVPASSPAHSNRVERYLDMGFSEVDAQLMACAKDGKGFFLYHHDVRRQLENGLTHELAVAIYA